MRELPYNPKIADPDGNGIATEVHCDTGGITHKRVVRGNCNLRFLRRNGADRNKDDAYLGGVPIARFIGKSPRVATSSYAGEIQAVFYCFDAARFLKSLSPVLLFGNEGAGVETRVRSDNSSFVENAHSINSVTNGRRLNGLQRSNMEGIDLNEWLSLAHMPVGLSISDELTKSISQTKLITLISTILFQKIVRRVRMA